MSNSINFDVAVIGRGIVGASAAWQLRRHGVTNTAIIGPPKTNHNTLSMNCCFATPSTIDNFSRLYHMHGESTAKDYLKFSIHGFDELRKFCVSERLLWKESDVMRLALSSHEANEMAVAVSALNSIGIGAVVSTIDIGRSLEFTSQFDNLPAAWVNGHSIIDRFEQQSICAVFEGQVSEICQTANGVQISVGEKTIRAEFVIVASHLNIKNLIPSLGDSIVSYADQVIHFHARDTPAALIPGRLIIAGHGHYWISCGDNNMFAMGGARFMRKWAGMEAIEASANSQITDHLIQKFEEWFGSKPIAVSSEQGILECRPCDELPIIGPMFGTERVLIGTGFMGSGLAIGVVAGRSLADLVAIGSAPLMPRIFWPERFRSLVES